MITKIIQFPLTRMTIALAIFAGFMFGAAALQTSIAESITLDNEALDALWRTVLFVFAAMASYTLYVRIVEGRPVYEFHWRNSLVEIFVGLMVGAGMLSVVITTLYVLGHYEVTGVRAVSVLIAPFIGAWVAGVAEEVALRGIVFRITEEWLGTWLALLISAALFGFLHLANPNASIFAATAIALEAGVLLAAVYIVTRRLWVVIGLHTGWNFTLGSIYGGAVSGSESDGLLISHIDGPTLLTGGPFGVEASIVTVIVGILLALVYLIRAGRRGHFVPPPWGRKSEPRLSPETDADGPEI